MVSEAKKPAAHCTPPKDSKRKKSYPAAFSKYKFYLDVKSSKVKTTLIEDIIALGGVSHLVFTPKLECRATLFIMLLRNLSSHHSNKIIISLVIVIVSSLVYSLCCC